MRDLRSVGNHLTLLASCASIIGLLPLMATFLTIDKSALALITNGTVCLILLLLFLGTLLREWSIARKERYADITVHIHMCQHYCRDLHSMLLDILRKQQIGEPVNKDLAMGTANRMLTDILNEVQRLFAMLTGTACRACVKTIYEQGENFYVQALARDKNSAALCQEMDRWRQEHNADRLEHNSDFVNLYSNYNAGNRCFLSNNLDELRKKRKYFSSSDAAFAQRYPADEDARKLPYKSAVVWPIQQRRGATGIPDDQCIGFLAVDSPCTNVFLPSWDFEIGAGIADSLYHPLRLYSDIISQFGENE